MQILTPDLETRMPIEGYDVKKNIMKPRVNILNHFLKTSKFASFNMAPYGV